MKRKRTIHRVRPWGRQTETAGFPEQLCDLKRIASASLLRRALPMAATAAARQATERNAAEQLT